MSDELIDEVMKRAKERVREHFNVLINQHLTHAVGGFVLGPVTFGEEPNGRDQPVDYRDPLDIAEDEDLVEAFECEIVVRMKPRPEDSLDAELHIERCDFCARLNNLVKICAHCLEERVCLRVPVHEAIRVPLSELNAAVMPRYKYLELCRPCRNGAHKGALTVTQ